MTALSAATEITLLAPSNDAFTKFLANTGNKAAASDSATLMGVLQYHVLTGVFPSNTFTSTQQFIPTMLGSKSSSNGTTTTSKGLSSVTGGQVVGAMTKGNKVVVMSGLKETSTVQTAVYVPL